MPRLDAELVARGIARSRERAKEMIKSGAVTVNGKTAKKPSDEVCPGDAITSSEQELYVDRGALKLEKAYEEFSLDFTGKVCLDIGASTGGFTEFSYCPLVELIIMKKEFFAGSCTFFHIMELAHLSPSFLFCTLII